MSLFPHQVTGVEYLASRKRAYLGDPPGFGKTRIAVEAARQLGLRPLVVCPAIVRTHWTRELMRAGVTDAYVMSYDAIVRGGNVLMADMLGCDAVNLLILDEAHYLKHPTSQRTKLLLGKDGYARRMEYVWALSGTPTPKNNPMEYWTILSTLFPDVALENGFSTRAEFQRWFCITRASMVRGHMVEKVVGIQHANLLKEMMAETMLRRSPEELSFRMPPVFKQFLSVDLNETVEEPSIGDQVTANFNFYFGPDKGNLLADPELARYRHKVGDAKAGPIARLLADQLENSDEKIVVFAHHRSVLTYLREALDEFGVCYIDGDTTPANRAMQIDFFQTRPEFRVFLGQTIACHTGITLTAAHRVVLVEPDWTDAVNVQAAARVARIGQTKETCIVQYVVAADTLDEGIIRSLAREAGMGETLYGS